MVSNEVNSAKTEGNRSSQKTLRWEHTCSFTVLMLLYERNYVNST